MSMNKDDQQTTKEKHQTEPANRAEARAARKRKESERKESGRKESDREETEAKEIGWHGLPMSRKRAFPVWLRLITLFVACAIAIVAGAMVGYGVLGHGSALDVFKMDTWVHIMKFFTKGT